ncbi:S-methyl-5-thioribose-1-phosphate isomerase [Cellulomonas sp. P24]|uniref:S-methyl-5-thioribose-1-phosphate isomerase n=1 Tax=Cellulomonas sp. P24 TaxID=2885206 RepID=UPI00216ABCA4|nr:S-methyl-5-thioribose-1-phosphate isomerase [Cellulomonas sp. P24]MCR6492023.1 S-methyl-5-thioribose-1-phosphate isomerase [Cellulomonas sp. P24]
MVLAIEWRDVDQPVIRLIDQTALPHQTRYLDVATVDDLVLAIGDLAVRGAPALGAAGALGVAMAMNQARREGWDDTRLQSEIQRIRDARPTAINLAWGVDRVRGAMPQGVHEVLRQAQALVAEDTAANRTLSRLGADWILARTGLDQVRVVTHCNTGALATTAWGTAYGIIHELHDRGRLGLVYADETRPLLQGARLTSWELQQDGIAHVVQADGAASSTILRGLVDVAIIGADRITANGDAANKIGSVALALACARAGIPFIVAAPTSTVDLSTKRGDDIVIEERASDEVVSFYGHRTAPEGVMGFNPAFDVTPHDLITAIVTERGVVEPATHPDPELLASIAR